jgi:hypothetical protein
LHEVTHLEDKGLIAKQSEVLQGLMREEGKRSLINGGHKNDR